VVRVCFFTRTTGLTNDAKIAPWKGCEDSPHPAGVRILFSCNDPRLRSPSSLNLGLIYFHASGVQNQSSTGGHRLPLQLIVETHMLDVVFLSRLQFGLTIMFHYLFPPLTIGMGVVLVYLEGMYLWTREAIYETAARFWTSLYAVSFAVGVATGIVMEFQFGTNWAVYSRFVGDVFGSALAAEGIFAFFLESGFLAVLVFGWDRVTPRFHFLATIMVSLGSIFSSIWIVVANSWQQTPAGHHINAALNRAEVSDFWAAVLNPSTINRLTHTLIGAFVLGSFFIMSISAYYLLRRRHEDFARRSFTGGLLFATIASIAALISGDSNARMVGRRQPAKLAAFERHFTTGPADLAFIPGGLSLLMYGDAKAEVLGLDRIRPEHRPPVMASYLSFRTMVALGVFFIVISLYASWLRWRGTLFERRWLLWVFVFAVAGAFAANELGWTAAEVGRQPWIVHPNVVRTDAGEIAVDRDGFIQYRLEEGLLTRNAVSESVRGGEVLGSILMFSFVYVLLFWIWIYVLNDKIQRGPQPVQPVDRTTAGSVLAAAAGRTLHEESMSEAKEP
jgi:cytochrome d ubiquinol oxidase subunit I